VSIQLRDLRDLPAALIPLDRDRAPMAMRCVSRTSPTAEPDPNAVNDADREEGRRTDQQRPVIIGRAEHD
jgi:hypothetical protein